MLIQQIWDLTPSSLTTTIYVQYLEDMYFSLWHKCANYSAGLWRWLQVEPCRMVGHFCWAQAGWRVVDSLMGDGWCALTTCTCSLVLPKSPWNTAILASLASNGTWGIAFCKLGVSNLQKNPCKCCSVGRIHPTKPMMIQTLLPSITSLPSEMGA